MIVLVFTVTRIEQGKTIDWFLNENQSKWLLGCHLVLSLWYCHGCVDVVVEECSTLSTKGLATSGRGGLLGEV